MVESADAIEAHEHQAVVELKGGARRVDGCLEPGACAHGDLSRGGGGFDLRGERLRECPGDQPPERIPGDDAANTCDLLPGVALVESRERAQRRGRADGLWHFCTCDTLGDRQQQAEPDFRRVVQEDA